MAEEEWKALMSGERDVQDESRVAGARERGWGRWGGSDGSGGVGRADAHRRHDTVASGALSSASRLE